MLGCCGVVVASATFTGFGRLVALCGAERAACFVASFVVGFAAFPARFVAGFGAGTARGTGGGVGAGATRGAGGGGTSVIRVGVRTPNRSSLRAASAVRNCRVSGVGYTVCPPTVSVRSRMKRA